VFNMPHVKLVNARKAPIQELTEHGLRTTEAEYEFDAIVFATGFDAMTGALAEIDVRTTAGNVLKEHWKGGPLTYLGLMVSGFPNMFIITGPGSPGVKSQMILAIEQHMDFIAGCLQHMQQHQQRRVEADAAAERDWVRHVNEVADSTLYPLANSWYVGANIPGKPRVFMPYVGGVHNYKKRCDQVAANNYEGFRLSA